MPDLLNIRLAAYTYLKIYLGFNSDFGRVELS